MTDDASKQSRPLQATIVRIPLVVRGTFAEYSWWIVGFFAAATAVFSFITEIRLLGHVLVGVTFWSIFLFLRLFWFARVTASVLAFGAILTLYYASKFKFWLVARRLHPHDFYLYLNFDNLIYAKTLYPSHFMLLFGGIILGVVATLAFAWLEGFKRPTRHVFAGIAVIIVFSVGVVQAGRFMELGAFGGGNGFMHFDHQHVSTFTLSSIHALPEILAGKSFDYGEPKTLDPAMVEAAKHSTCSAGSDRPNILMVMRESAMAPGTMPEMGFPNLGPDLFRSSNGRFYPLRVETHGAGSAHSIFSALTGLSAASFGPMMNIGIDLTINRIHMSVPQLLEKCGYRTVAVTTGMSGYVLDEQFYDSLGFDDYHDIYDVIDNSGGDTSDKAVYSLAAKSLTDLGADQPIFAYIDTTAAHGPYDTKLRPDEEVPEAVSDDPEANEYVRRLMLGERDFQAFFGQIEDATRDNGEQTLVVDFGDHQPSLTKYLAGRSGSVNVDLQQDDDLLITFFRLQSIGFQVPTLPDHPLIDVPFLGDWALKAAGFTSKGIYDQRWGMIERCSSRYWRCAEGDEAHVLHQTLKSAGLITIR